MSTEMRKLVLIRRYVIYVFQISIISEVLNFPGNIFGCKYVLKYLKRISSQEKLNTTLQFFLRTECMWGKKWGSNICWATLKQLRYT